MVENAVVRGVLVGRRKLTNMWVSFFEGTLFEGWFKGNQTELAFLLGGGASLLFDKPLLESVS